MSHEEELEKIADAWKTAATAAMLCQLLSVAEDAEAAPRDRAAALREARRIVEPQEKEFDARRYRRAQRPISQRPRLRATMRPRTTATSTVQARVRVDTSLWDEWTPKPKRTNG